MAKTNKFEEMLERLVNEDVQGAKDLFHEIVVEKSRDIYESLLENDMYDEIEEDEDLDLEESEEDLEESEEDLEESEEDLEEDWDIEEEWDLGEDEHEDSEDMSDMDMDDAIGDMDMDMDMEPEDGDTQEQIDALQDQLDDLKAELEAALDDMSDDDDLGDEEEMSDAEEEMPGDEDEMPGDEDEMMGGDPTDELEDEVEVDDEDLSEAGMMSALKAKLDEYTTPVTAENDKPGKGDNGAGNSPVPTKPNNMGGTASNLNQGGDGGKGGTGAKVQNMSTGNRNTPGNNDVSMKNAPKPSNSADSAKSMFS